MPENKSLDILKQAILLEKRGNVFYMTIAEHSKDPVVKEFFLTMAEEEYDHITLLTAQFRSLISGETFTRIQPSHSNVADMATRVLNKETQNRIAAGGFEAAALSAAILIEENAIRFYADRAQEAIDPKERGLYNWLSEWEITHLRFLVEIDKKLTESIWHDTNFWSF